MLAPKPTDVRVVASSLFYLPVQTRLPLKFGTETLTSVTCARVSLTVENLRGSRATGWGETPLSVQWVWPSSLPYEERHRAMKTFCELLIPAWTEFQDTGHALEIGHHFIEHRLPGLLREFNQGRTEPMPWLAALVCCSPFDIALHDAYGIANEIPIYESYTPAFLNQDLANFISPAEDVSISFEGKYPSDFFVATPGPTLPVWHLVGGKDWLEESERDGSEPNDGYPVSLREWIRRDQLTCLKIKLRGDDAEWDFDRLGRVGLIAQQEGVLWLTADFNCTVHDPAYVTAILDKLIWDAPDTFARLLYVEQPFPYDLEKHALDVHSVSARKPLFMDESAHDWHMIKLGRRLGWTGVALKTCKTQTGAILSGCWAKAHGMTLMVQDLTNPMLAQIPHVLLARHIGTIMGVESNAMQFYPEASSAEAKVHPGLYQRRGGKLDLVTIQGPGFGYRISDIQRSLSAPVS